MIKSIFKFIFKIIKFILIIAGIIYFINYFSNKSFVDKSFKSVTSTIVTDMFNDLHIKDIPRDTTVNLYKTDIFDFDASNFAPFSQ